MEENPTIIESLLERASEYGKTSYELMKLKTIDKTSDVVSSFIPNTIIFILITIFMIFLNLGLSFWLGKILGETYLGFLIVAGFYGVIAFVVYFFMYTWLKNKIGNAIIKRMLK